MLQWLMRSHENLADIHNTTLALKDNVIQVHVLTDISKIIFHVRQACTMLIFSTIFLSGIIDWSSYMYITPDRFIYTTAGYDTYGGVINEIGHR